MTLLMLGLLLFFGIHSVRIVAPGWRLAMIGRVGEQPWKGVYSLVALAGLALMVIGYGQARLMPELLYSPPGWMRHLTLTLLLPVFPLLLAAHLPGRIRRLAGGHPMLVATILWSAAHLTTTTTRADLLLFGTFLGWALADLASAVRRPGASGGRERPFNDGIVIVVGLALYALFVLWAHRWLIGLSPLG